MSPVGAARPCRSTTVSIRATNNLGFQVLGIGPRDTNPNFDQALGAKFFAIGSIEQTFPNGLPEQYGIKTALFTQFGTAGLLDDADKRTSHLVYRDHGRTICTCAPRSASACSGNLPLSICIDLSEAGQGRPSASENFKFSTSTRF